MLLYFTLLYCRVLTAHLLSQAEALQRAAQLAANLTDILRIPADADDTGCVHALHAQLSGLRGLFPLAAAAMDALDGSSSGTAVSDSDSAEACGVADAAAASSATNCTGFKDAYADSANTAPPAPAPPPVLSAPAPAPVQECSRRASSLFSLLQHYAYMPGSKRLGRALVDPRTYVWLHPFLQQHREQLADIALVTTWLQVSAGHWLLYCH